MTRMGAAAYILDHVHFPRLSPNIVTRTPRPGSAGRPDFEHEARLGARGYRAVAGVDEAGRGPLAGPVAVAAVILDAARAPSGLDDSKRLSAQARESLFELILAAARAVSIVVAPPADIDRLNIRAATLAAMARAVSALSLAADFVLVDGRDLPPSLTAPGLGVWVSVSAALGSRRS